MLNKILILLLILNIQYSILNSQNTWEHEYDPYPTVDGYYREDVVKCPDGGYAFCGGWSIEDPENPGINLYSNGITFKVNANGILEWIDQDTLDYISHLSKDYGLAVLADGGIITAVGPEFAGNCALIKRDTDGNRIWDFNPGFAPHSLISCEDGFVAAGYQQGGTDELKKYDLDGNLVWSKNLRVSQLNSVTQSIDGGFLTTGIYFGETDGDLVVIKTDSNGDSLWTRYYGSIYGMDEAKCVNELSSGEILVTGHLDWAPGFIWKLDQSGNTLDLELIDESIGWAIWSAKEYLDNSIITWGSGPEYNWILNRYDYNLDYLDTMDPISIGIGDKGFITEDEFLIYCQWPNLTVIKTLYQPTNNCDDEIIINDHILLSNYPNPFKQKTSFSFQFPRYFSRPQLEIYNIKGQMIETINIDLEDNSLIWDASENSSGIYLYQIRSGNKKSMINKMTILK